MQGAHRGTTLPSLPNMPSAAARRLYEDQIPSFMSVFHLDAENVDDRTITVVDPKLMDMDSHKITSDAQQLLQAPTIPSDASHKHNDSTSTQNSESAESSPITTASLTSSLSDHSPNSSPDSPVTLMPLSTFPAQPFGGLPAMGSLTLSEADPERPMTSPNPRKPKNMKGLSIQPPVTSPVAASTLVSEPSSPSFIRLNIPPMKRKPSQLSLKTSSNDLITKTTLEIPLSPGLPPILQRRALKHSTSSPHMLSSLKSAGLGPVGGMTIPTVLERNESGLSEVLRPSRPLPRGGFDSTILEEDSPIRTQIASRAAFEFEPYHEVENNEDQKTPGYPDGPIAIYGDNVYLYLEPTADEASRFDVVINVAREVLNPFKRRAPHPDHEQGSLPSTESSPSAGAAVATTSSVTAFESAQDDASVATPTTPKATAPPKQPEYIHIPWDHNTDIGGDLMMLCETIERKTKEGKRVLVHCQQGASRSASLIIAYGLYMNPELSVNDAYHAAQAKSKWISPNMRLMYCLQDFQKEVSRKRAVPGSAFRPRTGRSPTKHRATLSADAIDIAAKEPLTAPLPAEDGATGDANPENSPLHARGGTSPGRGESLSTGPSSAPSSFSWTDINNGATIDDVASGSADRSHAQPGSGLAPPLSLPPTAPRRKPPPPPISSSRSNSCTIGPRPRDYGFEPFDLGPPSYAPPPPPAPRREFIPHTWVPERTMTTVLRSFADDTALMSPRVEVMMDNPLKGPARGDGGANAFPGLHFVDVPPTPSQGLFSPRETMFPRETLRPFGRPSRLADPRSPPTHGETPIVRSIDELL